MVLKGCLEQFDYVAKRFVDAAATTATSAASPEVQAILNEAEEQQKQLTEKVGSRRTTHKRQVNK